MNLAAYLLTQKLGSRFLSNKYSFQNNDDIADLTLAEITGKVILFASDGFQGSGLEEIINYSWDNTTNNPNHSLRRLLYSELTAPGFDKAELTAFNRKGMTIIVPHQEGDFFNTNYNPIPAFEMGCQFVAMEYQYIDANMDYYITKFKNNSLVLKNTQSRQSRTTTPATTSNSTVTTATTTTTPARTTANANITPT